MKNYPKKNRKNNLEKKNKKRNQPALEPLFQVPMFCRIFSGTNQVQAKTVCEL